MTTRPQQDDLALAKKAVELNLITEQQLEKVIQLQELFKDELHCDKTISELLIERNFITKELWQKHILEIETITIGQNHQNDESGVLEVVDDSKTDLSTEKDTKDTRPNDDAQPNDDTIHLATISPETVLDVVEDDADPSDATMPLSVLEDSSVSEEEGNRIQTMMIYHELLQEKMDTLLPNPSLPLPTIEEQNDDKLIRSDRLVEDIPLHNQKQNIGKTAVQPLIANTPEQHSTMKDENTLTAFAPVTTLSKPTLAFPQIDGYKIEKKIGEGAMGTVYQGIQHQTNQTVAIKVLDKKISQEPGLRERFERERQIMIRLKHENLVSALDSGNTKEGMPFFVMEFIDGRSLGSMLEQGKLPVEQAINYTIQIAQALDYAYANRIIHRDIKPENMLITKDGVAKLCDLGLVREVGQQSSLTLAGYAIGTPQYISPEQALGELNVDIRSDIYSLGASLYHMVTGQVPFPNKNPAIVCSLHVNQPLPDPRSINPSVPLEICKIIQKCTAKKREDRYKKPSALIQHLQKCQNLLQQGLLDSSIRPAPLATSSNTASKTPTPSNTANKTPTPKASNSTSTSKRVSHRLREHKSSTSPSIKIPKSSSSNQALPELLPIEDTKELPNLYDTSEMRKPHRVETAVFARQRQPNSKTSTPFHPSKSKIQQLQSQQTQPPSHSPQTMYILIVVLIFCMSCGIVYWWQLTHPPQPINPDNPNPIETAEQMVLQQAKEKIQEIIQRYPAYNLRENHSKREEALDNLAQQYSDHLNVNLHIQNVRQEWRQEFEQALLEFANNYHKQYVQIKESKATGNEIRKFYDSLQKDHQTYQNTAIAATLLECRHQTAILLQERALKDFDELKVLQSQNDLKQALTHCNNIVAYLPSHVEENDLNRCYQQAIQLQNFLARQYKEEKEQHEKVYGAALHQKIAKLMMSDLSDKFTKAKQTISTYRQYRGLQETLDELEVKIIVLEKMTSSLSAEYSPQEPPSDILVQQTLDQQEQKLNDMSRLWIMGNINIHFQQWKSAYKYLSKLESASERNAYVPSLTKQIAELDAAILAKSADEDYAQSQKSYEAGAYLHAYDKHVASIVKLYTIMQEMKNTQYLRTHQKEIKQKMDDRAAAYINRFAVAAYFDQKFEVVPCEKNQYAFEIRYPFTTGKEIQDFVVLSQNYPKDMLLDSNFTNEEPETILNPGIVKFENSQMIVSFKGKNPIGLFGMYWKGKVLTSLVSVDIQSYQREPFCNVGIIINKPHPSWKNVDKILCLLDFNWNQMLLAETANRSIPQSQKSDKGAKFQMAILGIDGNASPSTLGLRSYQQVVKASNNNTVLGKRFITITVNSSNNVVEFTSNNKTCSCENFMHSAGHPGLYANSAVAFRNLFISGKFEKKWVEKISMYVKTNSKFYILKILPRK